MKYLITPSLINSFKYFMEYSEDEKRAEYGENANIRSDEQIRNDFILTLKRERTAPNEAMKKGLEFEKSIQDQKFDPDSPQAIIHEIVKEGIWQESCKKDINVDNQDYLLYGRIDVIKRDWIYDIKYTGSYELGKFLDSIQHRLYMYCTGIDKFAYLISDGKQFWREDYKATSVNEYEIKEEIREFRHYLKNDPELEQLFLNNWESK
jgi:hypothetical protein